MIYEIKITLLGSNPEIWRQIKIDPAVSLNDLHKIIQTAMGWTNSHLHQFVSGSTFYGNPEFDEFGELGFQDSSKFKVRQLLKSPGKSIIYEYDFGDSWAHEIKLLKIFKDETLIHPFCIEGKRNCPLEDSGGVRGYQHNLEIIKDRNHEEYEDTIAWMGTNFDPEHFNLEETNQMLAQKDYGCIEIID